MKETEALEFDRAFEAYMQYQDDRQNFKKQPISAERDLELAGTICPTWKGVRFRQTKA